MGILDKHLTTVFSHCLGDILGNHGTERGHQPKNQQIPSTEAEAPAIYIQAAETLATDAEVPATEAEALATEVPGSRDTGNLGTGSQRHWQLILAARETGN